MNFSAAPDLDGHVKRLLDQINLLAWCQISVINRVNVTGECFRICMADDLNSVLMSYNTPYSLNRGALVKPRILESCCREAQLLEGCMECVSALLDLYG